MKKYSNTRIYQNTNPTDTPVKAAIIIYDPHIHVTPLTHYITNNIVAVKIHSTQCEILIISIYFEPNTPLSPYLDHLSTIYHNANTAKVIIAGDANAKCIWWGGNHTNNRGTQILNIIGELNLHILNCGNIPTFDTIRGTQHLTSYIDITLCSDETINIIDNWHIIDNLTSSDHNAISFNITFTPDKFITNQSTTRKYITKFADWDKFRIKLNELKIKNNINPNTIDHIQTPNNLDEFINKYTDIVTETCNSTIPLIKHTRKLKIPWWSNELQTLKKQLMTAKRRIRCARLNRKPTVIQKYLKLKEHYETETKQAQINSWKEYCERQTKNNLWDGIYKIIKNHNKRDEDILLSWNNKNLNSLESAQLLANIFYPTDNTEEDTPHHKQIRTRAANDNNMNINAHDEPLFTNAELTSVTNSFSHKKAPGLDGFTADICSHVILQDLTTHLAIYNKCLTLSHFPTPWKKNITIIIKKPGREDYRNPKSYRPIGLLPILGKILEKLIVRRLMWHLIPKLSNHQYGFTPQRSTEDALYNLLTHIRQGLKQKKIVTLISLDIEGAFDSAWWPLIKTRLIDEDCPITIRKILHSYMSNRSITIKYAGQIHEKPTEKGCVQGSIGGPIIWNLILDPLLRDLTQEHIYCQAFADDIVLVFTEDSGGAIQSRANAVLERVQMWGTLNKLRFAPHKTTAMIITNKLKYDIPHLTMGGIGVVLANEVKILGLTIDKRLTFKNHIVNICKKATNIGKQLIKAARVSWGLHPEVLRTIYTATIVPIITYAAGAWGESTHKSYIIKKLNTLQRFFALKICKSYRTVSLNSSLLLAGLLPLDICIREVSTLYSIKRGHCQLIADSQFEAPTPFTSKPHPAKEPHLKLLPDNTDITALTNNAVVLYTDGSKIDHGVGAAVSVWKNAAEIKTRKLHLAPYCTVFQAELLAIYHATYIIMNNNYSKSIILSDSKAALNTIIDHHSSHPLATAIRNHLVTIATQNKSVSISWIKAHIGIEGNERADQLAKSAALCNKVKPAYDKLPLSYAKQIIRKKSAIEWNKRYTSQTTAQVTKIFFPDTITSHQIIKQIKINYILTQVFTGHGGFSAYLARFKCKESPLCPCDTSSDESIIHIIAECPIHTIDRHNIENAIDTQITIDTIPTIIADNDTRDPFLDYCTKIAKIVINRNKN